jgi:hypothetical protein
LKPLDQITALVIDHGLFLPVAHRLAEEYKRVLYYCPAEDGFPTINRCIVGDGFDDIEKCDDIWPVMPEVDLVVCPDIGFSGLQLELERQGKPVWGSRRADRLEIHRQYFHKVLADVGLAVPKFVVLTGLNALRDHLKDAEDKYIKISRYRGSLETFHWRSWDLDEGTIDLLAVRFGPAKELIPFLVFDTIETDLELGSDTYVVDGKWPSLMLNGIEHKDKGYLSAVTKREAMPECLNEVLEAFSPVLKLFRCRNQWSTEVRKTEDSFFFTDPTPRGGIPSTPSQLLAWKNFPEIVAAGAEGELVDPIPTCKYTAECMIAGKTKKEQWPAVEIPNDLEKWTAFGSCCKIDGRLVFPTDESHDDDLGWLLATGNTLEEVLDNLKSHADLLPEGLDANTDSMVDLLVEAIKAQKDGVPFGTQEIPPPQEALNV